MATRGRPKHPDILTPREWEVLALIRENLTNDQIGQRLGIGAEGAKYHVSEILGKLGLSSREEAAAWDPRQRPDWTPRWDPTRRPAWATALAPLGLFWRGLTGGLARSAGALATLTSVGLGVALVAGITIFAVMIMHVSGSASQPTSQAAPAATGKIAFQSNRDGNQEIYVMNADGSGQINLSNGPGDDEFGDWSPDGSRIAFTNRDGNSREPNGEVYVVNADGSGLTNLSNNPGDDRGLAWSPDGSRIAFMSDRDGNNEIYVMAADGSGLTNLTKDPAFDLFRAWSPDGSRIAFIRLFADNGGVYVVNADGSGQTNLFNHPGSPDGADDLVGWSPDGSRITFFSYGDGNKWQIYVVNADGSGLTNLTNSPGDEDALASALSPDGSRIAFSSARDGNYEIYVMNADGSVLTNLTNNPGNDGALGHQGLGYLAWSPDGSRISFFSDRDGNAEIYVMNADGSGQTNLTNNSGEDYDPVWSPAR